MSINASGMHGYAERLRTAASRTRREAKAQVRASGLQLQREARRTAPVESGDLRDSIGITFTADGLSCTVGTNLYYAAFQEYGTAFADPQPYLGPSTDKVAGSFYADMAKVAVDALVGL